MNSIRSACWLLAAGFTNLAAAQTCERPAPGSPVAEPIELRGRGGRLELDLVLRNERLPGGGERDCYLLPDGSPSPTLRLHPGDELVLRLKNELHAAAVAAPMIDMPMPHGEAASGDPCQAGTMSATSTNLHFHGLTVPARCHADEVLKTSIAAGSPPFEYRFRIPAGEPPGLYWYHPHIHGFSSRQVAGGASGALIVEGLERAVPEVRGLPERVLVIRDQDLLQPDAPDPAGPAQPRLLLDRDGDAGNSGTGQGKPAKDLSVNFVPVPYPDYPLATLRLRPRQRELWRVLNASSVTYLRLALIFGNRQPQPLGIVGIDGVPVHDAGSGPVLWRDLVGLAPGARAEFIVDGPPAGIPARLVTRAVDTGQGGENDPNRALVAIEADAGAPPAHAVLPVRAQPLPPPARPWLGDVTPVRVRKLYFSERPSDPAHPNGPMEFFVTVDGQPPAVFDPSATAPNIEVRQGDVEDWIVENRSTELHAFHIHQIHFQLVALDGAPVDDPVLRDTVNVPYFNGHTLAYPSVRLRMDFRDPDSIGTYVYHCHLLEHEDGGMMGTIRVLPAENPSIR